MSDINMVQVAYSLSPLFQIMSSSSLLLAQAVVDLVLVVEHDVSECMNDKF